MKQKEWKIVVTFSGMHDAMKAEELCKHANIHGRLIPTPVDITADCGMAYMMPKEEKQLFLELVQDELEPEGLYERYLRG